MSLPELWQSHQDEVTRLLDAFVSRTLKEFGERATVEVRQWYSDSQWWRRAVYFRRQPDGPDHKAFVLAVPIEGYPADVLIRNRTLGADNGDELQSLFDSLLSDPDVKAAAEFVIGGAVVPWL
jgi:hypothetical protein